MSHNSKQNQMERSVVSPRKAGPPHDRRLRRNIVQSEPALAALSPVMSLDHPAPTIPAASPTSREPTKKLISSGTPGLKLEAQPSTLTPTLPTSSEVLSAGTRPTNVAHSPDIDTAQSGLADIEPPVTTVSGLQPPIGSTQREAVRNPAAGLSAVQALPAATDAVERSAMDGDPTRPPSVTADGSGALSVQLSLPHIGALHLKVGEDESGTLSLNISAEREATLRALIEDQAHLHTVLREGGVQPEGKTIEFNLLTAGLGDAPNTSGDSGASDADARRNPGVMHGAPGGTATASAPSVEPSNTVPTGQPYNLVDITA